ncbi:MAG: alpha-amylase family glycosyl hydrolase [Gaiellaceae bacterium]
MRLFASAAAAVALLGGGAEAPSPPAGEALAALAQPPARTALASQRIYFVMTDRYRNGDPANDRGGLTGGRGVTGYDPADIGWFHGGDFKGLTGDCTSTTAGLARIKDLGFSAIWVTPPFGQRAVQGDSAAYHGYWGLDFTAVDPHLGTDADFAAFVDCAHSLGLKVILDVVVNHTADVIIPGGGSSYADAPYRDCKGKVFNPARYVTAKRFPCLRPADFPRPPVVYPPDRALKKPAWLNDVRKYHNRGDVDFSSCSPQCLEQGDFFGLDDLFTEQPAVLNGWAEVYGDWIRKYKVDGFRVDTAKHVNAAFFRLWVPKILAIARAAGVPDFQLFGEVFDPNALNLVPFVRDRGLPNLLDFPLQDAAASFAAGESPARAVSTRLHDDDYFRLPDGIAPTPATFLGNHDMGRAGALIRDRSGASGDELLRRVLLGHDLLYLLRGAPVVYYGDEVGLMGTGGDKAARQDLFPTQVTDWRSEARVGSGPIGTGSSFDRTDHPVAARLRELGRLRDEHPALSTGSTVVRLSTRSVLAVSRIDAEARREYVAVFNSGTSPERVTLASATGPTAWTVLLGSPAVEGSLTVTVPALSSVLLRAEAQIPARAPAKPALKVAGDDLSDFWRLSATAPGTPVSVSFAVLRKGKQWRRLGVDDSPPYRVFLDPRRFRKSEPVHLVAVARSLDGKVEVSDVMPFAVRRR